MSNSFAAFIFFCLSLVFVNGTMIDLGVDSFFCGTFTMCMLVCMLYHVAQVYEALFIFLR